MEQHKDEELEKRIDDVWDKHVLACLAIINYFLEKGNE